MKHSMVAALSLALGAWIALSPDCAEACTGPLGYTCGGIGVVAAPADANTLVFRNAYAPVSAKKLVRSTATPGASPHELLGGRPAIRRDGRRKPARLLALEADNASPSR